MRPRQLLHHPLLQNAVRPVQQVLDSPGAVKPQDAVWALGQCGELANPAGRQNVLLHRHEAEHEVAQGRGGGLLDLAGWIGQQREERRIDLGLEEAAFDGLPAAGEALGAQASRGPHAVVLVPEGLHDRWDAVELDNAPPGVLVVLADDPDGGEDALLEVLGLPVLLLLPPEAAQPRSEQEHRIRVVRDILQVLLVVQQLGKNVRDVGVLGVQQLL